MEVEVTFTAYKQVKHNHRSWYLQDVYLDFSWNRYILQVDIKDVIIPCHIDGMVEPLLLSITADVEGLQVAYAIQDSPHQPYVSLRITLSKLTGLLSTNQPYIIHPFHFFQ